MTGLLIGAVIISFSSIMVALAGLPPDVTGFYRLFVGGLGMLAILWRLGAVSKLTASVWKWSVLSSLFFTADFICWHRSIELVGPGMATMLANFQVLILSAVSVLLYKEQVAKPFYAAIPMALGGLYLMVGVSWQTFTPAYQLGVVFGLLTALAYGFYLLSLRYSLHKSGTNPLATACAVALLTGIELGAIALFQGASFAIPSVKSLAAITTLALVCHAGGWYFITRSIQEVRTSLVSLVLLLQPTLAYVWDILIFDKPTNFVELAGVGLALTGIYLGSIKPRKEVRKVKTLP